MTRPRLGAHVEDGGVRFAVWSGAAERVWVCLFSRYGWEESDRIELAPAGDGLFTGFVPGMGEGERYGLRADGRYDPPAGFWFDPWKLLVDPYALRIDFPYRYNATCAAPRWQQSDTGGIVPKALVTTPRAVPRQAPLFRPGGLIYEVAVRAFTRLHPSVPEEQRGTVAALAHPAVVEHLVRLGVGAVELMPVTATIDERHLPALGLRNAWGYNPVTFMALDPRLAPGGIAELRDAVAALHAAGIAVILDVVFNHTGESDALGPTLSLRGLDNRAYYRHDAAGRLVNDTGCGNTLDCAQPVVIDLVLASLRHFVLNAGVDGFRFDLAPVLGRGPGGFDPGAPLLAAIASDPVLSDRILIAEPWDIGPDGYQLGKFPGNFLEWNDRCRDDVRRFWRGDSGAVGQLATRLAGSSDVFARPGAASTRSVNFVAAHDGFALADIPRYGRKHNEANGEQNRDGHDENFSWNDGVEGETDEPAIVERRRRDVFGLVSTLFASRGTVMLTAGDEIGRTQHGNNNAYAQDNATTWLDWAKRDTALEAHVAALSALRASFPALGDTAFLTGQPAPGSTLPDVAWLDETGTPLTDAAWNDPDRHRLTMVLASAAGEPARLAVLVNGDRRGVVFTVPARPGHEWVPAAGTERDIQWVLADDGFFVQPRSVVFLLEAAAAD
ncbi:MAG: glycogen debranching protein GlgX [Rhizobiaceae bacterium]|nr:glycogen debranching protein GlgX [Rhizobiaceae bacterium]